MEVLLRLSQDDPPKCIEDIDWKEDYCPVLDPFPSTEFEYPIDLLVQLYNEPDRYGPMPRRIGRFDIISLRPSPEYKSVALLVADLARDSKFITKGLKVQRSRAIPYVVIPMAMQIPLLIHKKQPPRK